MKISDEEAFEMAKLMAKEEGILVGISTGANIAAAIKIAKRVGKGRKIVTVSPDGGEKYISMGIYE
jgi:cysteine synthase A